MRELPRGTVTFFFSDIENSTGLLEALGDGYVELLERHNAIVRTAFSRRRGIELGTEGDSFFAVFASAADGVAAAAAIQRALAAEEWPPDAQVRVRIGLHTGEAQPAGDTYLGLDVHRAARIMAAAHGGQTLISDATRVLAERRLPEGVSLRDLGRHRLRGLSAEQRLFQLVADGLRQDFPPPRTLEAAPGNLPGQLTSFIGRAKEIEDVIRLLGRGRIVTLTGAAGTGKTRLALEIAERLIDRFPDGVYFVPLAELRDAELLLSAIAQQLGLHEAAGRDPFQAVLEHLRGRDVLLIFDNFEQLGQAAGQVAELVAAAPAVRVLVTSRAPLHLYGEQEYGVSALALPDPTALPADLDELTRIEAVALFVERARAVKSEFTLTAENARAIARICARLDGLPLAIELAAARTRVLTPEAIVERLGRSLDLLAGRATNLPERQRTLRGAIDWSFQLLDGSERSVFACVSVFVGGASLSALEEVCGAASAGDVLETVESLAEKSLLRQGIGSEAEPRFTMLETIREYALERAKEMASHADMEKRHAHWFTQLAEDSRPRLVGAERRRALDRLEQEHDNIRAALAWAERSGETELGLRLVAALWRFWQMRGHLVEGQQRTAAALAMEGASDHPGLYIAALEAAGGLAYWRSRHSEARQAYGRALDVARQLGDRSAEAEQLYNLASADATLTERALPGADLADAQRRAEESLAIFSGLHDRAGQGKATWLLAVLAFEMEDYAEAARRAEQALAAFRELDAQYMVAWSLWVIANVALRKRRFGEALLHLGSALELFAEAQDVSAHVLVLSAYAAIAERVGDRQRAARLSGAALGISRAAGVGLPQRILDDLRYDPEPLRSDPETAAAWAEGERLNVDEARAYALEATALQARAGRTEPSGVPQPR